MLRSIRLHGKYSEVVLRSPRLAPSFQIYRFQHSIADEEKLRQIIASSNLASTPQYTPKAVPKKPSHAGSINSSPNRIGNGTEPVDSETAWPIHDSRAQIRSVQDSIHNSNPLVSNTGHTLDTTQIKPSPLETRDHSASSDKEAHASTKLNSQWQSLISTFSHQKSLVRQQIRLARDAYYSQLQDAIGRATQTLNDVTGYTAIGALKDQVLEKETELEKSRTRVKQVKAQYTDAIATRLHLQREVNELLTRKHNWLANDLERFTDLYRNDHANEVREQETQEQLLREEQHMDRVQLLLTHLILTRYHEEQIWSDKIRRALTYGTVILMGLNALLFIVATLLVEPWKRKRLVAAFEEKVSELLLESPQTIESNAKPPPPQQLGTTTSTLDDGHLEFAHDVSCPQYDSSIGVVPFLSQYIKWAYSKLLVYIHAFDTPTPSTPITLTLTKANAAYLTSAITVTAMVTGALMASLFRA